MLLGEAELLDLGRALPCQPREESVYEALGRRRPARQADHLGALDPRRVDLGLVVDQVRRGAESRATSARRLEFDELSEPMTSTTSERRATSLIASWRFWVA